MPHRLANDRFTFLSISRVIRFKVFCVLSVVMSSLVVGGMLYIANVFYKTPLKAKCKEVICVANTALRSMFIIHLDVSHLFAAMAASVSARSRDPVN